MVGFHSFNGWGGATLRVQVRPAKSWEELRECEQIQQEVWGTIAASSELLSVTQKCGGVVLGAFASGKMAGFLYAFLGRFENRLVHWSHMMAVREGSRDLGLGLRMKLAHRRLALAQGIKSICWTCDPLQSRNAALNVARLGVQITKYIPDCYGYFPSAIEKGLASDRFVANWPIASRRVAERLRLGPPRVDVAGLPHANETALAAGEFLENQKLHLSIRSGRLIVEIPPNTDAMRTAYIELATRWRGETRRIFQTYFRAGYRVEDFVAPSVATAGRCFYVLQR
jgi:predicted GNAT superfamily acetyltransferase